MYHLFWRNHDGDCGEEYDNDIDLAKRLLELARKEADDNYGTRVIAVIQGKEVSYEYTVDNVNSMEKLMLQGKTVITSKLPDLNERLDVDCPVCGCDAGHIDDVGVKINDEYVSLIRYECSECGREFYI